MGICGFQHEKSPGSWKSWVFFFFSLEGLAVQLLCYIFAGHSEEIHWLLAGNSMDTLHFNSLLVPSSSLAWQPSRMLRAILYAVTILLSLLAACAFPKTFALFTWELLDQQLPWPMLDHNVSSSRGLAGSPLPGVAGGPALVRGHLHALKCSKTHGWCHCIS